MRPLHHKVWKEHRDLEINRKDRKGEGRTWICSNKCTFIPSPNIQLPTTSRWVKQSPQNFGILGNVFKSYKVERPLFTTFISLDMFFKIYFSSGTCLLQSQCHDVERTAKPKARWHEGLREDMWVLDPGLCGGCGQGSYGEWRRG